ncbi:hypothetical protein [Hyalangium sp.]|uniref:hypothetical protein n=1 Tax=Hyalangium sp. TaxID=2028555 RepID=UPI002D268450|nr:hypothetical protein [Hyalangium sp.]HYH99832.1 hypothetical protein [Hyalangium sp.]
MSEYQYYEFRAVDRPLTDKEQAELRALSTRAEISAYHFSNVYHWGNFKGSPDEMVERYFDAHLYVTNWGVRRLMLRLPMRLFDAERASPFLEGELPALQTTGDKVILTFELDEAWSDELVQGEGWLASLLPLRQELLSGDLRALYLGWLAGVAFGRVGADEEEPPVPAGLGALSAALTALADFLLIPPELLEVAAQASAALEEPAPRAELEAWIHGLPAPEKDALLLRLVDTAGAAPAPELLHRFQEGRARETAKAPASRRTVGELLRAAVALQQARERQEKERQVATREKELEALAAREPTAWKQVDELFATRRPKDHAAGVQLLVGLREVARRRGTEAQFSRRLSQLRERNARRAGLISRMDREGLSAP